MYLSHFYSTKNSGKKAVKLVIPLYHDKENSSGLPLTFLPLLSIYLKKGIIK